MQDHRRPVTVEHAGDREVWIEHFLLETAAGRNVQIGHVAGMRTLGHETVLLVVRIEMSASRFEGRLALADLMDMEGVNTLGRSLQRKRDQDTFWRIGKRGAADRRAIRRADVGLG